MTVVLRLACLLVCAASCWFTAAESFPVVPIRTPTPLYPTSAAGSGLRPEVQVRMTIGRLGAVENLEIDGIEPSSIHDQAFLDEIRFTLPLWRFAPALVDGVAVDSAFEARLVFAHGGEAISAADDVCARGSHEATTAPHTVVDARSDGF